MAEGLRIEKLRRDHPVDSFDCGKSALNDFLIKYAFQNQRANSSQTYVGIAGDEVVGFYTLVFGQVERAEAPPRVVKGLPYYPVPVMILARLAVASGWQGKGLGAGLLKDSMLRTLEAAEIAGIRAFHVHAKDEESRTFYERFNFIPSPTDPFHMFLLLKDIRSALGGARI